MKEHAVRQLLEPLRRGLRGFVLRTVVALVDDAKKFQTLQMQGLTDETFDDCERFQQYGFTGVPSPGAEGVMFQVGGSRSHRLVLAVDDRRYRMKGLQQGEVAVYTDQGDYVIIRRGGHIEIKAAADVTITSPQVHLTGNLQVDGDTTVSGATGITVPNGDVTAAAIHLKTHKHGGVTAGGAQTGVPV